MPFKYIRKNKYHSLQGVSVNLTYYLQTEQVAVMEFEIMKVVPDSQKLIAKDVNTSLLTNHSLIKQAQRKHT